MTSLDISSTLMTKSDQLNSDDLIGGPITVEVERVKRGDTTEQPVFVYYVGCNNKPWKPCLTMRRALAAVWTSDAGTWVGKRMTLYRDPSVTFGKDDVGGIRVSHVSGIDRTMSLRLNSSKGKKRAVTLEPLVTQTPEQQQAKADEQAKKRKVAAEKAAAKIVADITAAADVEAMNAVTTAAADTIARFREGYPDLAELVDAAITARNEANKE